ncbi:hypothetical protein ACFFWD_21075, partial [Bradyrhizobium erythrophlei]|uniref:linalool dehydratase/isomerase domain-containing protein n=1 Tax=Bradyrhizobium erythrophlei TaxID=1437360 RepID=UPI0035E668A8
LKSGDDGALSINVPVRPEVRGQRIITDDCDFGWVTAWASEMGDAETLRGLLAHADRYMAPTWLDGGLYYPRNDMVENADGIRTLVEPMSGNVLLGTLGSISRTGFGICIMSLGSRRTLKSRPSSLSDRMSILAVRYLIQRTIG